jgi:hypothetical protein
LSCPAFSQDINPIDLAVLREIGKSNSNSIMQYTVNVLTKSKLKFVSVEDSTSREKARYKHYKFTDRSSQTLILTNVYEPNKGSTFAHVTYFIYHDYQFENFKEGMEQIGLTVIRTGNAKDGKPMWIWNDDQSNDLFSRFNLYAVSKESVGYKIVLH